VLGDRHQLHVGVALPGDVLHQLVGEFQVGLALAPGAEVDLVDGHRGLVRLRLGPLDQPLVVTPGVLAGVDDRAVGRGLFGEERHRVDLLAPDPVLAEDVELVDGPSADALHEQAPHARSGDQVHRVAGPPVEVGVQPHGLGVGGPHREPGAVDLAALVVVNGDLMGAEPAPAFGVAAVVETFQVPARQAAGQIVCHQFSSLVGVGGFKETRLASSWTVPQGICAQLGRLRTSYTTS